MNLQKIAVENGIEYSTIEIHSWDDAAKNPAGYRSNWERIEWAYNQKKRSVKFDKGTLIRDVVSFDGQYLVLLFQENTPFPEPCNLVVYTLEGQIHKIVCAPYMVSQEVIRYHQGNATVQGRFVGVANKKRTDGTQTMLVGIQDTIEYDNTGAFYFEGREFNPEMGKIGELIEVSLPLR
ncbi:hypothetical protein GCM10028808_26030 [Spirosoma migulaei]